jgi:hypothetical protein
MTLEDLIAAFRSDADDTVKKYQFTDEDIVRWLNEAVDEACIRAKLIFDSVTPAYCAIAVTPGVSVYPLNSGVLDITYATLVDDDEVVVLNKTDRIEMDRTRPAWRTEPRRPDGLIQYDTYVELNAKPVLAHAMALEVYRLPLQPMLIDNIDTAKPEISATHHRHLVNWGLHRGYSKPDAETFNPGKAKIAEAAFTAYFGERPDADLRKKQQANRPHFNKAW